MQLVERRLVGGEEEGGEEREISAINKCAHPIPVIVIRKYLARTP